MKDLWCLKTLKTSGESGSLEAIPCLWVMPRSRVIIVMGMVGGSYFTSYITLGQFIQE